MKINSESKIELRRFFSRKEKKYFIVWPESKTTFIELTAESFEALKLLKTGLSIAQVADILERNYEESFDVSDFVLELVDLGFVKTIDQITIPSNAKRKLTFSFIKKNHVAWIYSKPMLFSYTAMILLAGAILVSNPSYWPSYEDFFFVDNYLLTLVLSIAVGLALVFAHEFAHLIAGKAVGVDGSFSIGMRLFYPVVETNLTGLWSVPERQRILPFLAGMINDSLIVSLILVLFWLADHNLVAAFLVPFSLGRFLILVLLYGIVWQFLFFVRTDIYFVFSTLSGAKNLYGDSWQLIKNRILSYLGQRTKQLELSNRELRIVRTYSFFMLAGTVVSISTFIYYGFPILNEILMNSVSKIVPFGTVDSVQGTILFVLASIQIAGLIFYVLRGIWSISK